MRWGWITIFLNILTVVSSAQDMKARADSLYGAKNFTMAAPFYLRAASLADFKGTRATCYYDAACCYALSGKPDSAFLCLNMARDLGWNNKNHLLKDTDLASLHGTHEWKQFTSSIKEAKNWTHDPLKASLVTADITNFWTAYDLAQKDSANRLKIYREYYIDKGSPGLHDYFAMKVIDLRAFVRGHDKKQKFYAAIRNNTLQVEELKPQMVASFVKFKEVYADAKFSKYNFCHW